jgi:TfoX/Sxy family transcriptional regulator of competence genes
MAYDEVLASRIQGVLDQQPGLVEKKMFGGVAFLIQGNMAVGVHKDMLMVRVGPDAYDETMKYPNTRPFDLTGRAMKGWVLVEPDGITSESELKEWVEAGVNFALTLPPK